MVVFADKGNNGWSGCGNNDNVDACYFGIAVGVISSIGLIVFMVLDGVVDVISNVQQRKYLVISDVCFSSTLSGYAYLLEVKGLIPSGTT